MKRYRSLFVFKFAFDRLFYSEKNSKTVTSLLILLALFTGISLFLRGYFYSGELIMDRFLVSGSANTGRIEVNDIKFSKALISDIDTIEGYGFCYDRLKSVSSEVAEDLWPNHPFSENSDQGLAQIPVLEMDRNLLGVCKWKYDQDVISKEEMDPDKNYIILGSKYQKIPVGTVIQLKEGENYTVAGHLKKGSKWISLELLSSQVFSVMPYSSIDDHLILLTGSENRLGESLFFYCQSKKDLEKSCSMIRHKMNEQNISGSVMTFSSMVKGKRMFMKYFYDLLDRLIAVSLICSFLLLLCIQTTILLDAHDKMGIWYANGASTAQVQSIMLTSEGIRMVLVTIGLTVLSAVATSLISMEFLKSIFFPLMLFRVIPGVLGILLLSETAGMAITFIYISRTKPKDLIMERL